MEWCECRTCLVVVLLVGAVICVALRALRLHTHGLCIWYVTENDAFLKSRLNSRIIPALRVLLSCCCLPSACNRMKCVMLCLYKVVQIWPGQTVTCLHTNQSRSYLNHLVDNLAQGFGFITFWYTFSLIPCTDCTFCNTCNCKIFY